MALMRASLPEADISVDRPGVHQARIRWPWMGAGREEYPCVRGRGGWEQWNRKRGELERGRGWSKCQWKRWWDCCCCLWEWNWEPKWDWECSRGWWRERGANQCPDHRCWKFCRSSRCGCCCSSWRRCCRRPGHLVIPSRPSSQPPVLVSLLSSVRPLLLNSASLSTVLLYSALVRIYANATAYTTTEMFEPKSSAPSLLLLPLLAYLK